MRAFLPRFGQTNIDIMTDIFIDLASRSRAHEVTDDVEAADVILFTQAHAFSDWPHEMVRHIPKRDLFPAPCFTYDERDMPWCQLPGLYVSMPKGSFDERFQRAVPYAWLSDAELIAVREEVPSQLFTFVGSRTHRVRDEILTLSAKRGRVEDSGTFVFHERSAKDHGERRRSFIAALAESTFVLCPRGHGTSSIRLFETMAAGRIPVIISDRWRPPAGPVWEEFCIFVGESEVRSIPDRLVSEEGRAMEMSAKAAAAFDMYFAELVRFDYMMEQLEQLLPDADDFPRHGIRNTQYRRVVARSANRRTRELVARLPIGRTERRRKG